MFCIYELLVDTQEEAEEVLIQANDILSTYGSVSLADIQDLMGNEPQYTDNLKVWKNLDGIKIIERPDENAFGIVLPKLRIRG